MATRKLPKGQTLRQLRSDLAKLKRAGLYKGDVRNAKGGWRQKAVIKEYADVLSGKAKAVKVPKVEAKKFARSYKTKGDRVIVAASKGQKFRYTKQGIASNMDEYGTKFRLILTPQGVGPFQNLPTKAPKGKSYMFKLSHGPLMSRDAMNNLLNKYRKARVSIYEALSIYEVDNADFPGMDEDEISDYLSEITDE